MSQAKLKVQLLSYTPNPEFLIAAAAKLCYSKSGATDLMNGLTEEKVDAFINKIVSMGHHSPLEHVSFTFAIEGISRTLSHQLVRHRIASYSQQSQRYVEASDFEYVIPDTISENPAAKAIFEDMMFKIKVAYSSLLALDIPAEDARSVLANATETKIVVTMNARTLLHYFEERCCNRAQKEHRILATEMLKQVKKVAPLIFKNAGPECVTTGKCSEGKMSCGKPRKKEDFL